MRTTISEILPIYATCPYSGKDYCSLRVTTVAGQRFQPWDDLSEAQAERLAKRAQGYVGREIADLIAGQPSLKLVETEPCYGSEAWGSEDEMRLAACEA